MKCVICKHGETKEGKATVTIEENGAIVVVKSVPAMVCDVCGEEYISEEISKRLTIQVKQVLQSGQEINVCEFVAA